MKVVFANLIINSNQSNIFLICLRDYFIIMYDFKFYKKKKNLKIYIEK